VSEALNASAMILAGLYAGISSFFVPAVGLAVLSSFPFFDPLNLILGLWAFTPDEEGVIEGEGAASEGISVEMRMKSAGWARVEKRWGGIKISEEALEGG
jgi:hypothetical protein